jgi:putative pyruvate formate lyase activating enzyme
VVISVERLAQIFLELQTQGAENINLVTGTHYAPQIIEALRRARDEGLGLPVVWNTSTYENVETIEMLADHIDIWLADFRYASGELAERYSAARDYPRVAARALRQMHQATPGALIVRILLLPDHLADAKRALELSYEICGNAASYSLMSQYTPLPDIKGRYPELGCTVSADDYDSLVNFALDLGIRNSFMQVGDAASESFIPDFDLSGVLHV